MKYFLTVAALTLPMLSACGEKSEQPHFQVLGQAKIEKKAELFRIGVSISERGKSRMQSLEATSKKLIEIRDQLARLEDLKRLKVTTSDAKTKTVRPRGCDPERTYDERDYPENCQPVEFISSVVMALEGEPASAAGATLSLLTELKVEEADLGGYDVRDRRAAEMQARQQALKEATETARALAKQAGAQVGPLLEVRYGEDRYGELQLGKLDDEDKIVVTGSRVAAVPLWLPPDTVEFEGKVAVKFALKKTSPEK